ncbi:hypothetical protein F4774DRAFT_410220 [Daldinia eschscholtzii]|nr:hypothetical protein F4774DRAFT_410220 [Daldinia eschscholtzii]
MYVDTCNRWEGANFGVEPLLRQGYGPITKDLEIDIIPKAGHWIADENSVWVAKRIQYSSIMKDFSCR